MAKNNEHIYCVYCGKENKKSDKYCISCKKELNPKNRPFRDYIKEKVEDKLGGDVQDSFIAIMAGFIKTHLYGTLLTCSIVITAVSVVSNVVNNSIDFEVVNERPAIVIKNEYMGEELTAEEVVNKYLNALNDSDVGILKSLELKTFYPEIFNDLVGKESISDEYESAVFLDSNIISDKRNVLFKMENSYLIGSSYGVIPNGKYDNYEFRRFPVFIYYCFENNCNIENNDFGIIIDVEVIEVDGKYYVSGSEKEIELSIDQEINYNFLIDNNGDVSKFSKQDIDDYIMNLD